MVQKRLFGGFIPTCIREALVYVETVLSRTYGWRPLSFGITYGGRHGFIVFYDPDTGFKRRVYVVFQREPLHKAGELLGFTEKALTINLDALEDIVRRGYDFIVWVNKKGEIRMVSPALMLRLVNNNGWIRTTRSGETTAHIPMSYAYTVGCLSV